MTRSTYTYRCGERVQLDIKGDEFVVRALPDAANTTRSTSLEQVSSSSTRVQVSDADLEASMADNRAVAPTHHSYTFADSGDDYLITDRIFISFTLGTTTADVDALAGKYALLQLERYSDEDYLFQLTNHTGMNPVKLVVRLTEDETNIVAVDNDLNYRTTTRSVPTPNDPNYAGQWHLHESAFGDVDPRAHARCEEAWNLLDSFGNNDIVVAVTDDGCKLDHRDFDDNRFAGWGYMQGTRLVTQFDFDALPNSMYEAGSNHGTSCAGVIAGEVDGVMTVGAAPGCRLLPVKWESSGTSLFISDSKIMTVLAYLSDKVDIVSNSWGLSPVSMYSNALLNRIRSLVATGGPRRKGILFLWAAGNENCPIAHDSDFDIPYTSGWRRDALNNVVWEGVKKAKRFRHNLVGIEGVLHVAALASTAQRSHYSNYGTGLSLTAASSNSHTYWRMNVVGRGITTTTGTGGSITHEFGGTSSATPLVAGVAALVRSANPQLSAVEIAAILQSTASRSLDERGYARTPPASYDPITDWDISPAPPFDNGAFVNTGSPHGTWSPWFGHGNVNARDAVAAALATQDDQLPTAIERHQFSSTQRRSVPDNRAGGVRDKLTVDVSGSLQGVSVDVDITHTWIGDLRVTLLGPAGHVILLHNRGGGNTTNLHAQFDAQTTPHLTSLHDTAADGDWRLQVEDLANADRGHLQNWTLTLDIEPVAAQVFAEDSPGLLIPDAAPVGINRDLEIADTGTITDIEVEIDITHTYIGDLRITLRSPAGTEVLLHAGTGGSTDNLIQTYQASQHQQLAGLRGEAMQGQWRLHIQDLVAQDTGKLNRWGLRLKR